MAMSFVLDGLYLGSLDDVCATEKLKKNGINHILTIESRPVARHFTKGFETKFVHAFDMDNQDLLSQLEGCFQFIDEARSADGVLVHCFVGQSRSATVVLAYLMQKLDLTLDDAVQTLKKSRPQIKPNPGFQEQLELFEAMGNRIDNAYTDYKLYRLNNLAQRMQEAQMQVSVPEDMLSADPSLSKGSDLGLHYKCKKCRRPLFRSTSHLRHQTGKGGAAFDWRSRLSAKELGIEEADIEQCGKSLFIEPVGWMGDDILQQTGKLSCPKCHAKIGSFSWFGEHCPCGTWVIPAFHIQPSKVDECRPRVIPAALTRPAHTTLPQACAESATTERSADVDSLLQRDMEKLKT